VLFADNCFQSQNDRKGLNSIRRGKMVATNEARHVSLLALPNESIGAPIHGLYETLVLVDAVAPDSGAGPLFKVEIVGPRRGIFPSACGLPLEVHRSIDQVEETDIVIMSSMLFEDMEWATGRHPETVAWLKRMHEQGADLCSACAGALLLAETGLLDGRDTTTHWAFADTFRKNFPEVNLHIDEVLLVAGERGEFVMTGAASSWQDLIVYLISRHASPATAQAIGKFMLYSWDSRSQAPFMPFSPPGDHGDSIIRQAQDWLQANHAGEVTIEQMAKQSGLAAITFNRRFKQATGFSPIRYLQRLRVDIARHMLEGSDDPVEQVSWAVGYKDVAAFRRVFKRVTSLSPGAYRRKFRIPHKPLQKAG
jgi:transcriptional regulator GlxA family with amidase domain